MTDPATRHCRCGGLLFRKWLRGSAGLRRTTGLPCNRIKVRAWGGSVGAVAAEGSGRPGGAGWSGGICWRCRGLALEAEEPGPIEDFDDEAGVVASVLPDE